MVCFRHTEVCIGARSGVLVSCRRTDIGILAIISLDWTVTISDLIALLRHLVGQRSVNNLTVVWLVVWNFDAALASAAWDTSSSIWVSRCTV